MDHSNSKIPVTTLPLAGMSVASLLVLLPIFFTGQWDQTLLGICTLLTGTLVCLWAVRQYSAIPRYWFWLAAGWIVGLGIHAWLISGVRLESIQAWLWAIIGWAVFLIALSWGRLANIHRHASIVLIGTQLLTALGAFLLFARFPTRFFGWINNANALGGVLVWGVLLTATLAWTGIRRKLMVTFLIILSIAWLGTLSAPNFVAAALPLLLLAGFTRSHSTAQRWRRVGVLLMAMVVVTGVITFATSRSFGLTNQEARFSTQQRWEFIQTSLRLWTQKPVFGWGLGTYQIEFPKATLQANEQPRYAHNLFVQQFAETGAVGGVLWLLTVTLIGWLGWRAVHRAEQERPWLLGLWLGWLAFTLAAAFDFSWFFPSGQLWWWGVGGLLVARSNPAAELRLSRLPWRVGSVVFGLVLIGLSGMILLSSKETIRGKSKFDITDFDQAAKSFERAHQWWPTRENTLFLIRSYWARRSDGDIEAAVDLTRQSITTNPDDYAFYFESGQLGRARHDTEAIIEGYRAANERNPRFNLNYPIEYVVALFDDEQYAQAALAASDALRIYDQREVNIDFGDQDQLAQLRALYVIARQHNQ